MLERTTRNMFGSRWPREPSASGEEKVGPQAPVLGFGGVGTRTRGWVIGLGLGTVTCAGPRWPLLIPVGFQSQKLWSLKG